MILKNIALIDFKNYEQEEVVFHEKINCFTGKNGSGKTNLLDAVHYLGLTKSFLNTSDSQNVRHGSKFFLLEGNITDQDEEYSVHCSVRKQQKKVFKFRGKDYQKLSDHIGKIPVVVIAPTDSGLILDGSEERRKFVNNVIAQYNHAYLDDVMNYNRLLVQRNKLLKEIAANRSTAELLEILNMQMKPYANRIYDERKRFTDELIPIFKEYYSYICNGVEEVSLRYVSQLEDTSYEDLITGAKQKDMILQYTSAGVHKDDLELLLGDYPIKKKGSQGQQKTFLVALKLAQFDFIKKTNHMKPILLLDDVFDKFDANRVENIIELVAGDKFGQIFLSDTHPDRVKQIMKNRNLDAEFFPVENGKLIKADNEKA